jgi:ribonuclease HII
MAKPKQPLMPCFEAGKVEAGLDEAGRGCLAGPVVAAAVILPPDCRLEALNDSKQLSAPVREALDAQIRQEALAYAVAEVDAPTIDRINILQASFLAMHRALDALGMAPELLLVDGNRFKPYGQVPFRCIVKGDAKYMSIAAASILAKVHRDRLMADLALKHPEYGWDRNAGYPTAAHRAAIERWGATPWHRQSFRLLGGQREIVFAGEAP